VAYHYKPLDRSAPRNIRLLRLHRRHFLQPPKCDLVEASLDSAPEFEAISYTWGTVDPDCPVNVSGSAVLVTAAVDELLHYRRSIFGTKLFWIDAVCINQKDKAEKANQLLLMTDIYRRASRVLVWLGPPPPMKEATWALRGFIRCLSWPQISDSITTLDLLKGMFSDSQLNMACGLFATLFSQSWFERIYVVQEVACGQAVHIMYSGGVSGLVHTIRGGLETPHRS
jgi:heterokaryon incompatibility protein (HET)